MTRRPPTSTLFPYTTLFRSLIHALRAGASPASLARDWRPDAWLTDLGGAREPVAAELDRDRKSTRLNSSHTVISYAVFCLKKKKKKKASKMASPNKTASEWS